MYSDIKSWLQKENMPEIYDMKNECGNKKILKMGNSIDKYFIYKSVDKKMLSKVYELVRIHSKENVQRYSEFIGFDCDTCALMKAIYKQLWKKAICENKNSGISGEYGETMTSFQTTLNYLVSGIENEDDKLRRKGNISTAYCLELYFYLDNFVSRIEAVEYATDFANKYHTIGNFLPVPEGFNVGRSCNGKLDYWDITLMKIKEWYDVEGIESENNRRIILKKLLKGSKRELIERNIDNCTKWLRWCGNNEYGQQGWKNFIENNYMQDFVIYDEAKEIYLEPIEFCKEHSFDNPVIDYKDIPDFFKTCSEKIYLRSVRMIKELKIIEGI